MFCYVIGFKLVYDDINKVGDNEYGRDFLFRRCYCINMWIGEIFIRDFSME